MAQVYAIIPLDSFIDRPDHLPLVCPLSLCILNQSTAIAVILAVICTKNKSQEIGQKYQTCEIDNLKIDIAGDRK